MAAANSHIIRIPRTDTTEEEGAFILGEVSSSGSKPLNLKFVATEGEEPYVVKLRQDHIGELRVSSSPCSPDEWEKILKFVLLGGEPVEGIEAGAEAHLRKSITITIRRRVAGINQRLGTITLTYKANEGIQLFDWCGAALLEREKLAEDVVAQTAKVEDLESRVKELRDQLDELTKAKKSREDEMVEKFCALLNEKKVKIREQQRLLSTARVDPSRLAAVQAARAPSPVRVPKPSRAAKRKTREPESSEESDDAFEKMDVDKKEAGPASLPPSEKEDSDLDAGKQTPVQDDTETDSEADEDDQALPAVTSYQRKSPATAKGKGKEALTMHPKRATPNPPSSSPARAAVRRHEQHPPKGSETESDDEL
ncbi:DNA repair protein XRCC4 [Echria macrotheca]|uniref:DNA repair protein XRCC4 n=1 Tax=Echria macrotheca TaxID=438768 RepID=A0AAJ0BQI7_9PEZI|nr:DNA repair protein XRCC4 [Echria macrotheca]